jgi:hypothetical protein
MQLVFYKKTQFCCLLPIPIRSTIDKMSGRNGPNAEADSRNWPEKRKENFISRKRKAKMVAIRQTPPDTILADFPSAVALLPFRGM